MPSAPKEMPKEKPVDWLNPAEVAKLGVQKSVDGLRALLDLKNERMNDQDVTALSDKSQKQFAVAQDSIMKRQALSHEIRLAA